MGRQGPSPVASLSPPCGARGPAPPEQEEEEEDEEEAEAALTSRVACLRESVSEEREWISRAMTLIAKRPLASSSQDPSLGRSLSSPPLPADGADLLAEPPLAGRPAPGGLPAEEARPRPGDAEPARGAGPHHLHPRPPSVLEDAVLEAMGVVPARGVKAMGYEDTLAAIEELVSRIAYGDAEPKEDAHPRADEHWSSNLFAFRARVRVLYSRIWWFLMAINLVVFISLEKFGEKYKEADPTGTVELLLESEETPLRLLSVGVMFLVVFRTKTAFKKWSVARDCWVQTTVACRTIASHLVAYCSDPDGVLVVCRLLIMYVVGVRSWLRKQDPPFHLIGQLATPRFQEMLARAGGSDATAYRRRVSADASLPWDFKHATYPLVMIESMRAVLDCMVTNRTNGPFQGSFEASLKTMSFAFAQMNQVQDTEMPLSYIALVRTCIAGFFVLTPLFLIKSMGWFGIAFPVVFAYFLFGLENLAEALTNPFGWDCHALPIDTFVCKIARDVGDSMQRRHRTGGRLHISRGSDN